MRRILSVGLVTIALAGILYACNFGSDPTEEPQAVVADVPPLTLAVQPQAGTFNAVGQTISYQYFVTNTGTTALTGPVIVTDDKIPGVLCPPVNTVGNANDNLDPAESVTCTSTYTITGADLNTGSVTNNATASAGGVNSNTLATTVQMTLIQSLELTNIANPTTYNQSGQVITFTYTVRNAGTAALGPAQFVINDDRMGAINCGAPDTTLAVGATLSCTNTYTTTENDRGVGQLVFNSIVSGAGATTTQPVSVTVTNTAMPGNPSTSFTPGSTIQHQVNQGEWMIQIARCYGADFKAVRNANPQVVDPDLIWPINVLTIPVIGSNGNIYGPPCVTYYTVVAGDTWSSIAQKFNADVDVLMAANKNVTLAAGVKLKIPLNSANGIPVTGVTTTPSPQPAPPIRITFPAGTGTVSQSGTVRASNKVRYVLTASAGQTLNVKVTTPIATDLQLAVLSASGTVLKAQDGTLIWSGTIPANADYFIDVVNITTLDKTYTLDVSLMFPAPTATPGPTSTPITASTFTPSPSTLTPTTTPSAVERVVDINPGAPDSSPSYLAVFNNGLYFSATGNDNAGAELWKYDGTTNTISRVKDIFAGAEGSNPAFLASYNGLLYFSANGNDNAGVELWRYNGTETGRLTDINTGAANASPSYMTVYNDLLYFSAKGSDGKGVELWTTDGTAVNRVTDIYPDAGDANPAHLAVFNNALYFSATSNDGKGTELWKYDGTNATRVTDINPGVGNANPAYLTVFNNILYFSANANDGKGTELWKFDGTTPSLAADVNPGPGESIPSYLAVFNNVLYFSANGNDSTGYELWKFDGTTPSRVADINKTGDSFPSFLAVYNNNLFFQANGGDNTGKELWRFKGP